ncbi:MAG: hypothetical protein Q8P41_14065 [Pseudomonadota bacterium]|nr:hypothetical protein [Pseudomonadota bacterium]
MPTDRRRADSLALYIDQLGKAPDAEIAALTGMTAVAVKAYRVERGIKRYRRAAELISGPKAKVAAASPTPSAREPVPAAVPAATVARAPTVPTSPLDAYRDRLGKEGDVGIAEEAGVTRHAVAVYRKKLGIPAYDGYRFEKGRGPPTPAAAPTHGSKRSRSTGPRGSKIDAFAHLAGVLPDAEVARMAGTTPTGVRLFRRRRGIPAAVQKAGRRVESATVQAAEPAVTATPEPIVHVAAALTEACVWRQAFRILADRGEERQMVIVIADHIVGAVERAAAAFGAEWTVRKVKMLGEGLSSRGTERP